MYFNIIKLNYKKKMCLGKRIFGDINKIVCFVGIFYNFDCSGF